MENYCQDVTTEYDEYDYINSDVGFVYRDEDEICEDDISFFSGDKKCRFCKKSEADLRFRSMPICIDCMCALTDGETYET